MLKRLSSVLLLGGLLGLAPMAAQAAPGTSVKVAPADPSSGAGYDLMHHYRCMYRCDGGHRYKHGDHRHDKHRYKRGYKDTCWYYGNGRWYRARCGRPHGHGHGHGGHGHGGYGHHH